MECWSNGVMGRSKNGRVELWNNGMMEKPTSGLFLQLQYSNIPVFLSFSTPTLQYSITPTY
jgi:hypothetical protein